MELAIAFATVVTVPSDNLNDMVARNGDESIFCVLQKLSPEVISYNYTYSQLLHFAFPCVFKNIKTDMLMETTPVQSCYTGSRKKPVEGKVARSELNKALQTKCGFVCSRSRKKALVRCAY